MVLGTGHGQDLALADHGDEADLLTQEKFLEDDPVARAAKAAAGQDVVDGRLGGGEIPGQDDALARCEPIGLDDDGGADLAQIRQGGFELAETGVGRRGDTVTLEKILGEGLGPLQLGRPLGGSEAGQSRRLEAVHQARHQGGLGTDDGEADGLGAGEGDQGIQVLGGDVEILDARFLGGTAIAGGDEDRLDPGRLGGLPGQGMFAATAADDQDIHEGTPVRMTASGLAAGRWRSGEGDDASLAGADEGQDLIGLGGRIIALRPRQGLLQEQA